MLSLLDLRSLPDTAGPGDYRAQLPRAPFDVEAAVEHVRGICARVQDEGAAGLRALSRQWDGVEPPSLRVPGDVLRRCADELPAELRAAFTESIRRRRAVAADEGRLGATSTTLADGATVTTRTVPVRRVGLYVPGGLAPLASSVLMNVVPAQAAGVSSLAVASPPQPDAGGWPHPTILALCHLLGVEEVYAVGGAQAVAMFAYGVPDVCPRVDLVTGPGNIYVVAAKRLLRSVVGIDSEAGPTEIAVIADDSANPQVVAADMVSQAEHDPLAAAVLITASPGFAEAVTAAITPLVAATTHADRIRTALSGKQSAVVLVRDLDQALAVADAYAAEHLEIHTRDAAALAGRITNAGAIFVGPWSPVALGDYAAGSTHVLPTAGSACYSSGLTVNSFVKTVQIVDYSEAALLAVAHDVETFAAAENLPAHGAAVALRRSPGDSPHSATA